MIWIYMTFGDHDEAKSIVRALLEAKLIACANIFDSVSSLYWWEGQIEESEEVVAVAKTKAEHFQACQAKVQELHSYDVPCVVSLPISEGLPDYLKWLGEQV